MLSSHSTHRSETIGHGCDCRKLLGLGLEACGLGSWRFKHKSYLLPSFYLATWSSNQRLYLPVLTSWHRKWTCSVLLYTLLSKPSGLWYSLMHSKPTSWEREEFIADLPDSSCRLKLLRWTSNQSNTIIITYFQISSNNMASLLTWHSSKFHDQMFKSLKICSP